MTRKLLSTKVIIESLEMTIGGDPKVRTVNKCTERFVGIFTAKSADTGSLVMGHVVLGITDSDKVVCSMMYGTIFDNAGNPLKSFTNTQAPICDVNPFKRLVIVDTDLGFDKIEWLDAELVKHDKTIQELYDDWNLVCDRIEPSSSLDKVRLLTTRKKQLENLSKVKASSSFKLQIN